MSWRNQFLRHFGPGALSGITLGDWLVLLAQNRIRVNPRYFGRAATISLLSVANSILRLADVLVYGHRVHQQHAPAPVFIIGHWRSGTTHLHNLFSVDDRYAYATLYDVTFPHWCLSVRLHRFLEWFVPKKRWQDNVGLSALAPAEDEGALCQLTGMSSVLSAAFPQNMKRYGRYLSFRQATDKERERWQRAFVWFVNKLYLANSRQIVLKSPDHTARIRMILEVYPDARFVHIRRNPWNVFRSNQNMWTSLTSYYSLQRLPSEQVNDLIIRRYKEMYECFFDDLRLIPEGQYCETSYEKVVQQPMREMRSVYETLGLADFECLEPRLRNYLATVANYETNRYVDVAAELQAIILKEWRQVFDEWDYPIDPNADSDTRKTPIPAAVSSSVCENTLDLGT